MGCVTDFISLAQVINTVTAIVDCLPRECFEQTPSSSLPTQEYSSTHFVSDTCQSLQSSKPELPPQNIVNIIRELVETERNYVRALEAMLVGSTFVLYFLGVH